MFGGIRVRVMFGVRFRVRVWFRVGVRVNYFALFLGITKETKYLVSLVLLRAHHYSILTSFGSAATAILKYFLDTILHNFESALILRLLSFFRSIIL